MTLCSPGISIPVSLQDLKVLNLSPKWRHASGIRKYFCGYEYLIISDEKKLFFLPGKKKEIKKVVKNKSIKKINKTKNKDKIKKDPNSPFAVLEKLL